MLSVDTNNFDTEVLQSTQLVSVKFFATWCGPCKMLTPVIEKLAEANPNVKFVELDVDKGRELAHTYEVQGVPAVILFKDGKPVDRVVGLNKQQVYQEVFDKNK